MGGLWLSVPPRGFFPSRQARKQGLAAPASSCHSPGSESLSSFPGQVALNLFLLIQELYL